MPKDSQYHVGDVWRYKTREGEEESRLTVVQVDVSKLGTIVHIAVDKLNWKNCEGGIVQEQIPHMPFAKDALEKSATIRIASGHPLPAWEEGYEEWRRGFVSGHAGIYTITISQAVSLAERTWRTGLGCGSGER
ncbi:MAG TPA: hypothetical protein VKX25_11630 [Bryobacteraceae bacterium]|jgi:hypothetical protein|nr:hypothetical protein [Bryobacteraceae bacterium]